MATTWELDLPNGIRTPSGVWTKRVELSEMIGEDEDTLADTTRAPGGKGVLAKSGSARITDILARCTVSMGGETRPEGKTRFNAPDFFKKAWLGGYTSDRSFAMIRLRQCSLGDIYWFTESCPNCKKEIKRIRVDLTELQLRSISLDLAQQDGHTLVLPRSGDKLVWRFLRGVDEETIEDIVRKHKGDFLSAIFYERITSVNGEKPKGGLDYLKKLSKFDRDHLRMTFDAVEGGIETDIQITCDECGTEFSRKIEIMGKTSFFFPSETGSDETSKPAPSQKHGESTPLLSEGSRSPDAG